MERLPAGDTPECFAHHASHTIHVRMLPKKDAKELPSTAKIEFGDIIVTVKIELGSKKCFKCGERGHEAKLCPKNDEEFPAIKPNAPEPR